MCVLALDFGIELHEAVGEGGGASREAVGGAAGFQGVAVVGLGLSGLACAFAVEFGDALGTRARRKQRGEQQGSKKIAHRILRQT